MFYCELDDEYKEAWNKAEIETYGWEFQKLIDQHWINMPVSDPVDNMPSQEIPVPLP